MGKQPCEKAVARAARKKGVRDPDAYTYGGMRREGWKPKRERGRGRKR